MIHLLRLAEGLLQNRKLLAEAFRAFFDRNNPSPSETAVALLMELNALTHGDRRAMKHMSSAMDAVQTMPNEQGGSNRNGLDVTERDGMHSNNHG